MLTSFTKFVSMRLALLPAFSVESHSSLDLQQHGTWPCQAIQRPLCIPPVCTPLNHLAAEIKHVQHIRRPLSGPYPALLIAPVPPSHFHPPPTQRSRPLSCLCTRRVSPASAPSTCSALAKTLWCFPADATLSSIDRRIFVEILFETLSFASISQKVKARKTCLRPSRSNLRMWQIVC
jgi:hypothetical protein